MSEPSPRRTGPLLRGVRHLHFLLAAVVGALTFLVLSGVGLLYVALSPTRANAAVLLARTFHAVMTFVVGWRVRVEGREVLAAGGPVVYMVRHHSNLDIVLYGGIYPRRTVVVGKKEVGKIPVFGWFFRATGNVLLDRGDLSRAIDSIRAAAERVRREGISVWVFPEGHRNDGTSLLPFKKGPFHLAVAAQVPIVPIVSDRLRGVLDGHRLLVRPGRIRIRVLPAIATEGFGPDDVPNLMESVRARMQGAQDALTADEGAPVSA